MRLVYQHTDAPRRIDHQRVEHRAAVEVVVVVAHHHIAPAHHLMAQVVGADLVIERHLAQAGLVQPAGRRSIPSGSWQTVVKTAGQRAGITVTGFVLVFAGLVFRHQLDNAQRDEAAEAEKNAEQKMLKSIEAFRNELAKVRTGRAHPGILDQVHVDYYGSPVPISQVANVSLLDSRTISIQPWEKGMGAKIEKAIRESDLGLNPSSMGDLIRVPMPAMTEERRKELTKVVRGEGENAKIAVRNLRRDANEAVKKIVKDKLASEDDQKRSEADIQKVTDRHIVAIDQLVAAKEQDLMAV